jgi:hypothetical protein
LIATTYFINQEKRNKHFIYGIFVGSSCCIPDKVPREPKIYDIFGTFIKEYKERRHGESFEFLFLPKMGSLGSQVSTGGSESFVFMASCFGYFGYHSKCCLSGTPFSTVIGWYIVYYDMALECEVLSLV